jgi:hypothetical protein
MDTCMWAASDDEALVHIYEKGTFEYYRRDTKEWLTANSSERDKENAFNHAFTLVFNIQDKQQHAKWYMILADAYDRHRKMYDRLKAVPQIDNRVTTKIKPFVLPPDDNAFWDPNPFNPENMRNRYPAHLGAPSEGIEDPTTLPDPIPGMPSSLPLSPPCYDALMAAKGYDYWSSDPKFIAANVAKVAAGERPWPLTKTGYLAWAFPAQANSTRVEHPTKQDVANWWNTPTQLSPYNLEGMTDATKQDYLRWTFSQRPSLRMEETDEWRAIDPESVAAPFQGAVVWTVTDQRPLVAGRISLPAPEEWRVVSRPTAPDPMSEAANALVAEIANRPPVVPSSKPESIPLCRALNAPAHHVVGFSTPMYRKWV